MIYVIKMLSKRTGKTETYSTAVRNPGMIPAIMETWTAAGYEILSFEPLAASASEHAQGGERPPESNLTSHRGIHWGAA